MGYCNQADLSGRYGDAELAQATDESGAAEIDAAEVQAACDEASAEIDSYLGRRYAVPITEPASTLALLKGWACVLARLKLWGNRAGPDSGVRAAAEDAMRVVRDIGMGRADLAGVSDGDVAVASVAFAQTERTQVMSDDRLSKMVTLP